MDRVEKIESQVRDFSAEELAAFREWFHKFDAHTWDAEIEADALDGRLDALANEALNAHRAGRSTPL